jgi:hypothetical protein
MRNMNASLPSNRSLMLKPSTLAAALGAACLTVLVGCGGGSTDTTSAPEHRVAEPAAEFPPPTRELALHGDPAMSLEQQVAALRREVAEIRRQIAGTPGAGTLPNPHTDPEARLEAERAELLRMASTESTFRREDVDARWSQSTIAAVRAALADAKDPLRNAVRSVECRSQSCRVEIDADGDGPLRQDLPLILGRLTQVLPNMTAGQVDQGNGYQATVLYLSR